MDRSVLSNEAVQKQLEKILASERFSSSPQIGRFLSYVVSKKLAGEEDQLKSYAIGVDALGRPENFDPQNDPIVRVEARRLRKALSDYYENEGRADEVHIILPKGGYRPSFEFMPEVGSTEDALSGSEPSQLEQIEINTPPTNKTFPKIRPQARNLGIAIVALAAIGLAYLASTFLFKDDQHIEAHQQIGLFVSLDNQIERNDAENAQLRQYMREFRLILGRNERVSVQAKGPDENAANLDYHIIGDLESSATSNRLSIELLQTSNSKLVWGRSYDIPMVEGDDDINKRIATNIATELNTQIMAAYVRRLQQSDPKKLSAAQLVALATWVPGPAINTLEWESERAFLARMAIEKDDNFGAAHSVLADKLAYLSAVDGDWNTIDNLKEAGTAAIKAMELNPGDANVIFNVAQFYWHTGQINASFNAYSRVVELNPNHAIARFFKITSPYSCLPAPDEVLQEAIDFDKSLAPDNPLRWVTLTWHGWLHLNRGEFEKALRAEERAAQIFRIPYTAMRHAAILVQLGRVTEARALLTQQRKHWPNLDPLHFATVTMPRICQEFPGEHDMVRYYQELANAAPKN